MFGLPNLYIIGIVGAIIVGLFGWAIWERHDAQAAIKGEKAARLESDLHAADAERWHKASDERDKAIETFKTAWENSNAKIEAARLDTAKLQTINTRYAAELRAIRDAAGDQEQETKNDARKRPAEVHHLGAVACAQYRRLYGEGAACTDTQSADANGN